MKNISKSVWLKKAIMTSKRILSIFLCAAILGTTVFPDSGKAFAASIGVDTVVSESVEDAGNTNGFVRVDNTIENPDPRFGEPEVGELQDFSDQEAEIVGEIIESRDQSQKEFLLEDMTRLLVVYPEAVHYEEDGEWKEIDNALKTERKTDGTMVLKNTDSIVDIELPQTLTAEDEIALTYDGYRISFRLEGAVTPLDREEIELPVVPVEPITPITPVVPGEEVQQSSSEAETKEVALSESAAISSLENVVSLEGEEERQDSMSETPADTESVSVAESQENAQLGMESIADETTTVTENASEAEVQESSNTESSVQEMASTADESESESETVSESETETKTVQEIEQETEQEIEQEIKVETVQPESQIQLEETVLTAGMMIAEDIMVVDGPEEELLQMRLPAATIGTVDNEVLSAGEKANMTAKEQRIYSAFADSKVKYSAVLPQTDIIYNLTSTSLKESIVLKSCPDDIPEYRYFISCDGLTLVLNEDNSISAKTEDDEEIFTLPAPFIMDSGEEYTYEVEVTLEETDGGYSLTYHLPDTWIRSSDRVWPLVLDPVVETAQIRQTIQDKYVASNATTDHNDANLSVGYHATKGIERIYLQFRKTDGTSSLPALTAADVILDARLYLARTNTSTPSKQVNVHRVTSAWDSETLQWSNKPGYDSNIADYDLVTGNNWYSWEITDIARSWYADGNNGLILKMNSADENVTSANNKLFCSSDSSSDYRPILTMLYRNSSGLEGFWDYDSYDLGRGGMGDINLFTGNLVWTHHGLSYDGNLMPVAVNLIYNANDRNGNAAEHDYGFGYGWRTPYHQEVGEYTPPDNAEVSGNYYFWDDEDGTRHYFKETSTSGTYEDEFGAELTLKVASDGSVTIKDKDGNTSYFDTEERLIKIENNQQTKSAINITYTTTTGHLISKITDGAGRVYQFTYSSGKVSSVSYKGNTGNTLKSISYTYTSGDLTKITYPDSKYVTFTYSNHLLTGVEDIAYGAGAMKAVISYNQTGVGVPNRVSRVVISDKDSSGTKQRQIDYVYRAGYTTIKDQMGNELQYQFNKYGNTVCIKDADGNAVFAEYATDISDSGTPNQLKISSKLQTTVRNYLYNTSFEESAYWVAGADLGATGSHGYSSDQSYLGQDSYRLTMDTTTGCVQVGEPDWVTVTSGKMYTFSAYLKTDFVTENGTGVRLVADTPSTSYFSDAIKVDSDWQRLDLTITVPSGVSQMKFWVRLESKGTIYADCIQLVEGPLPSRFNLVENGDFTYSGSGSSGAYGWLEGSGCGTSDVRVDSNGKVGAPGMDDLCYTMIGSVSNMKRCYQDIDISGSAGDTYSVGGWARGDVAAVTDDTRVFGIVARFYNTDGTESETQIDFNPDLNGSETWQYASGKLVAEKSYSYIRILLVFEKEVNQVWFDGITLTKDEFGNSYTHDADGNVTSIADIQKQESDYEYKTGTNDLISSSLPGGRNMTYTYDNYHNVISAVSGRNQKSNFAYDAYGRNTSVSIPDSTGQYSLVIEANATYNGSYVSSITDTNRNTVLYSYDLNYGELDWVQGPMDEDTERTTYTYDTMHRLTGSSKPVAELGGNLSSVGVSYTYEGDNLKTITHSNDSGGGTTYTLNYGLFDALTSVKVGNRTLITNTYDYSNQNFNLSAQTYGNGDTVSYTYDKTGRLLAELHDGTDKVTYDYDAEGNLGKMSDFANTLYFKYYYDLSGRLSKVKEAGSMPRWQYYSYDIANNLSKYEEEIGGVTYGTSYTYDTDNRHTITEAGANGATTSKRIINYEQYYGRTNYMASVHNGNEILKSQFYQYKRQGEDTHASYQLQTWNIILPSGTQSVGYTYDENGNMLSVGYGMNTAANKYDGGSISYAYDGLQQLVREENEKADAIWVYIYDAGGNIVKKETYGYTTRKLTEEIDYYYTDEGQWGDLLTEWNGKTFTYDSIGNLTSDGIWSYTWEHGRQLAGMSKSGTSISYTYAPDGMRRTKTVGSTAYKYYYDGDLLTHMTKGSSYIHIYYDANGNPISMYYSPDGGTYYYLQNPQGDVIGLLDSSGNLVVEYYYDAWGKSVGTAGSKAGTVGAMNPLRYRGYIYDTETSLYYITSRYYNPEIGRFINTDSVISTGQGFIGNNMFAYCLNNPVNYVDRKGTEATAIQAWTTGMWWLCAVDSVLPVGDLVYTGGIVVLGLLAIDSSEEAVVPEVSWDEDDVTPEVAVPLDSDDADEFDYYDDESNFATTKRVGKNNGKAPRNNKNQNRQFKYIVKKLKLTPQQARRLHDAITKKGLGIDEIMDLAMTLFGKGPR